HRPHRPVADRGADRRDHRVHRRPVLPRGARVAARRRRDGGILMARLGTIVRLAERRHGARPRRGGDGAIVELDTVTVRFEDQTVVDAVSASVARGEWVALIGANGAGKTTLLRAVAGLVEYQGVIRLDGGDAA